MFEDFRYKLHDFQNISVKFNEDHIQIGRDFIFSINAELIDKDTVSFNRKWLLGIFGQYALKRHFKDFNLIYDRLTDFMLIKDFKIIHLHENNL